MLRPLAAWIRSHKAVASAVAIALVASVPVTFAVLHQGFPAEDVNLDTRDVWVTNAAKLMGGRLNHQIDELDAAVTGGSSGLDVLQDGGAYFLVDSKQGTLERIDPAYVSLVDRVSIPVGSQVSYGGNTVAITSPEGSVWVLDASNRLSFDASKTAPSAKLGTGAQTVVAKSGVAFSASPSKHQLVRFDHPGVRGSVSSLDVPKSFQLSAVGDTPVLLDGKTDRLQIGTDRVVNLPGRALQLQQPGDDNDYVLLATGGALLEAPLDGSQVRTVGAGIRHSVTSASQVSAPVWLNGCSYGAWAGAGRYLYACDGKPAQGTDIAQAVSGSDLRFRVNHGVIALNNLQNGDAWVVSSNMRLVQNWAILKPNNEDQNGETGEEKPVLQSFADTLAHRTQVNQAPTAVDDNFGVRAGRATVLPVLSNDTDPDGDVLTVTSVTPVPAAQGRIDIIDGGRSVQLTVQPGVTGSVSFRYTIDDGRGGTASAQVNATVHPDTQNAAPVSTRESDATVEVGQSVTYNVLTDWIDPDGDDVSLTSAASTTDDQVQFAPDGRVTFLSKGSQTGVKEVKVTISDGRLSTTGSLMVTVKPAGTLDPVATPDFASGFATQPITIHPLDNDISPSGQPLNLVGAALDEGAPATLVTDSDKGQITFTANQVGDYYLKYTLGAGPKTTQGLIRVVVATGGGDDGPIAVADDAYVRPGETTTVNVLANDSSPSGRVLAVRSVSKNDASNDLNVEVLDNSVVKITAPTVLSQQEQLTYVVSDGVKEATAGITVVPIPPLVNHQPPIANDDTVNVRAGDIATVSVLDNDYSPDNEPFTLDPALTDVAHVGNGATAFVSGDTVRYQAPQTAGQYSVVYSITDKYGQKANATVTFVVNPADRAHDRAPDPQPLTVRAFAGSSVPVVVPLDGIDPDGDSVTLQGIDGQPSLGRIAGSSTTGFTYEAYPASGGTDSFTYKVADTFGKVATGTVRVGVVPRPSQLQPPIAVNDTVQVRPGKTASVPVLTNDSDPNGYAIALQKKLADVDDGLKASVKGSTVLAVAPQKEGVYVARYTITNGHGGQASAYVQVIVTKDAKPVYPTAIDHVVQPDQIVGKSSVRVDVLDGAVNPSNVVQDLKPGLTGPNASAAKVLDDGIIAVTPQKTRVAVAYTLTDPNTGLKGQAFIVVPPQSEADKRATAPPRIKPGLPQQIVQMNGDKTWKLSDIIDVPSGRSAKITGASGVSATNSAANPFVDAQTLKFVGQKDYRGPASVTFKVDDGKEEGSDSDRITSLVLPVTVGSPDQSDVAPTFTPPNVTIEAGENATKVDLRASSYHPNPDILSKLTYTDLAGATSDIQASISGSTLSVSSPFGVQPGATTKLTFKVNSGTMSIDGSVNVKVVSSTRPLATQKAPPATKELQRGKTIPFNDAAGDSNWINPFPGHDMTVASATAVNSPKGVHVTYNTTSITVSADSSAGIGTVNVQYTVQDATKDPARTKATIGQLQITIHDVPSQPSKPVIMSAGDGQVVISISAPANNGKPISSYTITWNGGSKIVTTTGDQKITGLTNGKAYAFQVKATNDDGDSQLSPASDSATPWGTPDAPGGLNIDKNSTYAPSTFHLSWNAVSAASGGGITYSYRFDGGGWNTTTGTSATSPSAGAGNHYFEVKATNGGGHSSTVAKSKTVSISDPPPPPPAITLKQGPRETGYSHSYTYDVTIDHFAANTTYTLRSHCDGGFLHDRSMTTDGSGHAHFVGANGDADPFCGYTDVYVLVGSVQSDTQNWRDNNY